MEGWSILLLCCSNIGHSQVFYWGLVSPRHPPYHFFFTFLGFGFRFRLVLFEYFFSLCYYNVAYTLDVCTLNMGGVLAQRLKGIIGTLHNQHHVCSALFPSHVGCTASNLQNKFRLPKQEAKLK